MQSQQDLERIRELGAPRKRISCTGNLKFDYAPTVNSEKETIQTVATEILKGAPGDLLLICGSTKPGEEELLLSAFGRLRQKLSQLRLLIAPRHPHRGDEVAELTRSHGWCCLQRSKDDLTADDKSVDVLVLDSIGELASIYEIGDLVFVGGSLVPEGGQNMIEAAACGKAILFGPHMENFRQVARAFVEAGGAVQLSSPRELEEKLEVLLSDPDQRSRLGQKALQVVKINQGAVTKTVKVIQENLPKEYEAL
jgi:3-deoxy-D-manno-octulosonic-acid transferase